MRFLSRAAIVAAFLTLPALAGAAETIRIVEPFVRVSGPTAKSGAAFMTIENLGAAPDRLIEVRSDAAQRVELHTHRQDAAGVMQMIHVPEGFEIGAGAARALARGGDHVMLMGLARGLTEGEAVEIVLVFEKAGEIPLKVPVGAPAAAAEGQHMHHGAGHDAGHGSGHSSGHGGGHGAQQSN